MTTNTPGPARGGVDAPGGLPGGAVGGAALAAFDGIACVGAEAQASRLHEGDFGDHVHEISIGDRGRLVEYIWKVENVELTTVGIDIGSSTSHLMFAKVRLQRKTQLLSSQFVVVDRRILWKSPILLTPFLAGETIDARRLGEFVDECYAQAGLARADVDTGAVILTGEAIKKVNAQAIAELFAADSGKFVCASAGHHLECVLSAHGSGAVARSRDDGQCVLNVDIGGGTTKLALIAGGEVVDTCAVAVGGRLVAFDSDGRVIRADEPARGVAAELGIPLRLGERPDAAQLERIVDALAGVVVDLIAGRAPGARARALLLTSPLGGWAAHAPAAAQPTPAPAGHLVYSPATHAHAPHPHAPHAHPAHAPGRVPHPAPDVVTFSGGVSEYIYGREERSFGDIARALAAKVSAAFASGRIATPMVEPGQGIRATVIGASQFSVQVSGKTIHISEDTALPLRNIPVISPSLPAGESLVGGAVAEAIAAALARSPVERDAPLALALRWRGEPHYAELRALADGIAQAVAPTHKAALPPLILMIDGDVGKTLGHILEHELGIGRHVVSIDGIQLREFDYVDIGTVIQPANVVPVVIKSLLFPSGQRHA